MNTYAYVGGNPVGAIDPLGLSSLLRNSILRTGPGGSAGWNSSPYADGAARDLSRMFKNYETINRLTNPIYISYIAFKIYMCEDGDSPEDSSPPETTDSDGDGLPDNVDRDNLSDRIGDISDKTGMSPRDVKDKIHDAKRNLPKSGPTRNPDVVVDTSTGEVYPQRPGGGYGDSIGNIYD